eukprot:3871894-Pyramimonas_sp.AAC.1
MSATITDAWASASAPVSSGCCIGRSCYIFVLVQRDIAVLILGRSDSTIGARALVDFTLTKGVLQALDALVIGVLCAGHID